jgi:hypothetical protein
LYGINPVAVDYLMLFQYLVTQEVNKNRTSNIFLVLNRLQESLFKQTAIMNAAKNGISLEAKVKDMKEYFPYLASIKKWYYFLYIGSKTSPII